MAREEPRGNPVRRFVDDDPLDFDAAATAGRDRADARAMRGRGLLPVVSIERLSGHPFSGGYDCKEIADRLVAVFPEGAGARRRPRAAEHDRLDVQAVRAGGRRGRGRSSSSTRRASKSRRVPWFDCALLRVRPPASPLRRAVRRRAGALPAVRAVRRRRPCVRRRDRALRRHGRRATTCSTALPLRQSFEPGAVRRRRPSARRLRNRLGVRSELNPTPVFGPRPLPSASRRSCSSALIRPRGRCRGARSPPARDRRRSSATATRRATGGRPSSPGIDLAALRLDALSVRPRRARGARAASTRPVRQVPEAGLVPVVGELERVGRQVLEDGDAARATVRRRRGCRSGSSGSCPRSRPFRRGPSRATQRSAGTASSARRYESPKS